VGVGVVPHALPAWGWAESESAMCDGNGAGLGAAPMPEAVLSTPFPPPHPTAAELDRGNVLNARVVLAEALRKCPTDQPLFTLAAGVELEGGDLGAGGSRGGAGYGLGLMGGGGCG